MATRPTEDAAAFARRHAGELDATLTPAQRDLLGRVIARRIARGVKLEAIARAAAQALPELGAERARRLGRDEALRALAWERLEMLRAQGETEVVVSAAADACATCRVAAGRYPIAAAPALPVPGCAHASGCRCMYRSIVEAATTPAVGDAAQAEARGTGDGAPEEGEQTPRARPWYRKRPPRPHGPRWTEEQRAARRGGQTPRKAR